MDNENEILDNVVDGLGPGLGSDSLNMKASVPDKNKR